MTKQSTIKAIPILNGTKAGQLFTNKATVADVCTVPNGLILDVPLDCVCSHLQRVLKVSAEESGENLGGMR